MLTKILYFVQNKSFNIIYLLIFWQNKFSKKFFYPYLCPKGHTITPKLNFCPKCCQKCSIKFNLIISLVPNCPGAKLSGAKLSWCQIVRVANCPLLLFWCQIVCFYYLGAKLSVFIILVPSCPLYYLGAKLSSAKLSGAKLSALLSWCQIVRCQIVRFYYVGAKLSWC